MTLRRPIPKPPTGDILLAMGILIVEVFAAASAGAGDESAVAAIGALPMTAWIVLLAGSAVLVLRRHRPLLVLTVVVAAYVMWHLFGYANGPSLAIFAAMYGVGRYISGLRTSLISLSVATAAIVGTAVNDGDPMSDIALSATIVPILPWYVGRRVAARHERLRLLEERAEFLERERAAELRRVVEEERRSIARELHDVVAHRVSVMTVQAGAAQAILDEDPARAAKAMNAVEDAGRSALDELRHLLDVLGPRSGAQPRTPSASLHDLPEVAEEMGVAGLPVSLDLEGAPDDLPRRVDLSAFRIVQESLTNTLRHAGPDATARVTVAVHADQLVLEVVDDGSGGPAWPGGSGRGLAGMRERVELLGGRFEAGPVDGGGFRVRADIPLNGSTQ